MAEERILTMISVWLCKANSRTGKLTDLEPASSKIEINTPATGRKACGMDSASIPGRTEVSTLVSSKRVNLSI